MNYRTKSLLEPDMKLINKYIRKSPAIIAGLLLLLSVFANAQNAGIPSPPNPPHLVNDFAGILSAEGRNALERKLVAIDDSSSTQIAIVTVTSLNGYEISDMATRILETWGVGQKEKNNGIVILVKLKTQDEKGEVFITTGYGLESVVPDAICKRIVENEIIPSFKTGQFYEGLDKATNTLYSLTRGEFTPDQYLARHKKSKSNVPIVPIIVVIMLAVAFFGRGSGDSQHFSRGGGSLPFWLLMGSMMGSGRSSGGGFGDFSGGSGGFGGFGGGSGGGGGAGGSW
jgi:uncharacterized protein